MGKTVTLSVKQVPADLAKRLRERASRNHRSLQGELRAILEHAAQEVTPRELASFVKRLGLSTRSESARMLRADRDDARR
jgi:plasmid stability protein